MQTFESFCEEISTNVETRILSWHGRNNINTIQAIKLIDRQYMLGGFIISADVLRALLMALNSIYGNQSRLHDNELKRDNEALASFYRHYKERYDKCENNESIEILKKTIASHLYRLSMEAIDNTYEFGG